MDADDALRAVDVDERVRDRDGHVRLHVPERGDEQHARLCAGAHEMSHQLERRRVGPVHVLEDEQQRRRGADADEEVRDGRVQAVTLGVGVRRGARQVADPLAQAGQKPRQLTAARAEMPAQRLWLGVRDEVLERRHERPVGRPDDAVAIAVEDGRLCRDRVSELAHEPALARPGLAGNERCATTLGGRSRQQGPQGGELAGTPRERICGRQP